MKDDPIERLRALIRTCDEKDADVLGEIASDIEEQYVRRSVSRGTAPTYYKWLRPDRTTTYQNVKWPKRVGAWTDSEPPILCQSGWHGMEARALWAHLSADDLVLWEVEVRGEFVRGDDKFAAAQMRLVREVGRCDPMLLRLLACDIAESVLPIWEKAHPDDPRVRECIVTARKFALGLATERERDAAQAAARAAARDAAWAAWDAARAAWDAARAAARDAARAAQAAQAAAWAAWAARAAAEAVAGAAARAAAWAAARAAAQENYGQMLVDRLEAK